MRLLAISKISFQFGIIKTRFKKHSEKFSKKENNVLEGI